MSAESPSKVRKENYQEIIGTLFPDDIHGKITEVGAFPYDIHPAELALVKNATPKRINEFSAGRFCAHTALTRLAIADHPLLIGDNRAPVWPQGVTGSISHCRNLAGAVVAASDLYRAIGIDIENIKTTRNDISKYVCTVDEKDWLVKQRLLPADIAVLLIFSIKESVYKCIYQLTKKRLGFQECNVTIDMDSLAASCNIHSTKSDGVNYDLLCRFVITEQHIFSGTLYRNSTSGQEL